jgi:glycosyltransferase involved in cell wall biosynthesis
MESVRISVIIPSYQSEEYLEDTVQSVLSQAYPNLELIVIDGASRDGSLKIIQKYSTSIDYWVSEPDKGQSNAINKGFAKSTGDIITFLGSDDIYIPGTISDVAAQFEANPGIGAIIGAFQVKDEASNTISEPIAARLTPSSPIDLTLIKPSQYRLHQVSTFYTRTALENVGFCVREDLHYVMDRELLYRVCQKYPIILANRVYGVFRKHNLSKSERDILPFSNEFASIYMQSLSGEPYKDRLRRYNASYFRASGLLKFAKTTRQVGVALSSLVKVLYFWPGFLFEYSYIAAWQKFVTKWLRQNNA